MERKVFLRVFLLLLLLLFKITDVFTSEDLTEIEATSESSKSSDDDDQLQVPLVESSCSCPEEIKQLRELLDGLQREFTYQKETEIHRQHDLDRRIQLIFQGLQNNQTETVKMHMKYIQEHIVDESILQRISESLWNTLLSNPNTSTESIQQFYKKLRDDAPQSLYLPFFYSWFHSLDDANKLTLQSLSLIMSELELTLRKSKPIELAWWTKETEAFFLNRIHSHLLSLLASIDLSTGPAPRVPSVHDRVNFQMSDLTTAFSRLSKLEVYTVIVDTLESELAGELLSSQQLKYFLNKIYAFSATFSPSDHQFHDVYQSEEDWKTWKEMFGRKFILDSIVRDVLSKVSPDVTDAASIGLKYIENWSSFFVTYGNPEDDILLAHVADVILHAIQNNVMTYDPSSSNYWKLIQQFEKIPEIILKYPFLVDDVKATVAEKYDNKQDNYLEAVEFTKDLGPSLKYLALKQLISSMRENGHLNENLGFQVGFLLLENNFNTDPIWMELPEQVQTLMGVVQSSSRKLLWRVRAPSPGDELKLYEIVCHSDFSIGLFPLNREGNNDLQIPEDSQREWIVKTFGSHPVKIRFQMADSPVRGGLVLATAENGTQYSRHVKNSRDRKNGMFTKFQPRLTERGDAFNLIYQIFEEERELQVLYDEQSAPYNLGIGTDKDIVRIAEFVVTKAP